jgi:hypothetical protein
MTANNAIAVGLLEEAASRDTGLVNQLTGLINGVYATAEIGLWRDGPPGPRRPSSPSSSRPGRSP